MPVSNQYSLRMLKKAVQQQKTVIWFFWFVSFIWLNKTNKMNKTNQIDQMNETGWRTF
jgi:hypothetical protein